MRSLVLALAVMLPACPAWAQQALRYTVFAELHPPLQSNRLALQKALKKEGIEAHAEGDGEVALLLTAAQIRKLFQAKVTYRKVEASSLSGTIEQAYLESATIPSRFAKYIRRVYLDPQRG